jgi:exopolysaccharide production protein ExoQ
MSPIEHNKSNSLATPVWILRWIFVITWAIPIVPALYIFYSRAVIGIVLPLLAVAVILRYSKTAMFALRAVDPWIWVLAAYTALSISWSPVPWESTEKVVQELAIPLVAIALLAAGYSSSWLTTNLRIIATILLLLSIFVCVVLPQYGITYGIDSSFGKGSRWMGVMNSKNQLGRLCLLCAVCWLFTFRNDRSPLVWRAVIVFLSIVTLFFTNNATSMVVMAVVLLFYVFVHTVKRGWMPVWFVASVATLAIGHVVAVSLGYPTPLEVLETATGFVGRDSDLTGRADLWAWMWGEITKHPWIGAGYGAGITGAEAEFGVTYSDSWTPTQGHSSYVDILLETGIVGLALWAMVFISHGRRLLALSRIEPDLAHFHAALLICVLLCSGFSTLFYRGFSGPWNIILWVSLIEVCYVSSMYRRAYPRLEYAQQASA